MAALWVTVPCMYMYSDMETSYWMGSPLTHCMGEDLSKSGWPKIVDKRFLPGNSQTPGVWEGRVHNAEHLLSRARVQPRSLVE